MDVRSTHKKTLPIQLVRVLACFSGAIMTFDVKAVWHVRKIITLLKFSNPSSQGLVSYDVYGTHPGISVGGNHRKFSKQSALWSVVTEKRMAAQQYLVSYGIATA